MKKIQVNIFFKELKNFDYFRNPSRLEIIFFLNHNFHIEREKRILMEKFFLYIDSFFHLESMD